MSVVLAALDPVAANEGLHIPHCRLGLLYAITFLAGPFALLAEAIAR